MALLMKVFISNQTGDGQVYCNATFDGWGCWNYTLAGTRSYNKCPLFLQYRKPGALAFKDCLEDGTWWRHPKSGKIWSDYTPCYDSDEEERFKDIVFVYLSGYAVSIVLLFVSIIIFSCFRQLKCARVTLHKNLFISFIFAAILWILTYSLVALNPGALSNNPMWCRVLHVVTNCITMCNYAWMFCEGFYLHTLIIFAFTNTKRLLIICYVIGWGFPVIPVVIYTGIRSQIEDSNKRCWINESNINWILSGPIALSLIVNFAFLINILRILLSKMRAVHSNEAHQTRRTVRATLILIPLLGLQYILIPFRPEGEKKQYIFNMVSAVLTSFQGVFVALLFCFLNGEVVHFIWSYTTSLGVLLLLEAFCLACSLLYGGVQKSFKVLTLLKKKWREILYMYHQEWRSNTVNNTVIESTYVPRGSSRGSISKQLSSTFSKTGDELHLQHSVPYRDVPENEDPDNGEV